jgi:thioredoxin 1
MLTDSEITDLLDSHDIVLLKFTADWCERCKKYEHFINDLSVYVQEVDHDLNEDLIEEYEIKTLPTILVYKNKNLVERIEGFIPKTEFVKKLTNISSHD